MPSAILNPIIGAVIVNATSLNDNDFTSVLRLDSTECPEVFIINITKNIEFTILYAYNCRM